MPLATGIRELPIAAVVSVQEQLRPACIRCAHLRQALADELFNAIARLITSNRTINLDPFPNKLGFIGA